MTNQDNQLLLTQALGAYQQGDIEQAKTLVRRILSADGRNVEAWLLAINLTSNTQEQRVVLGRAKRALPENTRILKREQELFGTDKAPVNPTLTKPNNAPPSSESRSNLPPESTGPRKAMGYVVPDDPNIAPFWMESRGGIQPADDPVKNVPFASSNPVIQSTQQTAPRQSVPTPPQKPVGYNIPPTLDDGVVLKRPFNPLSYLPMVIGVAALGLCILGILAVVAYAGFRQRITSNSPSAVAMNFYPAIQSGDNATLSAILTDDIKSFCGSDIAGCYTQHAPISNYHAFRLDNIGASSDLLTTIRISFQNQSNTVVCQNFYTQNISGTWKIAKLDAPLPCASIALGSTTIAQPIVASLDATQLSLFPTMTLLAQTKQAMINAPTLTAIVLAPGITQTALANEQNQLNAEITATQARFSLMVTETAVYAGMTNTVVAQTQATATAQQQAVAFKSILKGTIATSKTVNGQPQIVIMNADGSNSQVFSEIGVDPAWSPDGQRIAFVNREHNGYAVHTMAADGSADTELTGKDITFADTGYPTWSPDGQRLMFEASRQFGRRVLVISTVSGTGLTQVLDGNQSGGAHSWSPDGTQALFTKDDQIWLVNVNDNTPQPHSIAKQSGVQEAAWSPDGKQIVFDAGNDQDRGLYVMNADGTNIKRITQKGLFPSLSTWSPDGKYIAAMCSDRNHNGSNLCVMNADGSSVTYITTDGDFNGRIAWKPASK